MENATKALLIAAGIMVAIMILSLLMMGYNQISSYYANQSQMEETKQLTDFNETFENYNRKNIRGTDLITLMNKVIDYNERFAYQDEKRYSRITVNIAINHNNINDVWRDNFLYPGTATNEWIVTQNQVAINNKVSSPTATVSEKRGADNRLIAVASIENELIVRARNLPLQLNNLTSSKLQKLAANISNIILDSDGNNLDVNTDAKQIQQRYRRDKLIKDILNIKIDYADEPVGKANTASQMKIDEIQKMARQYYQFTQFKRAYFDCIEVKYDTAGGRINEMNFEVQINDRGEVVFN